MATLSAKQRKDKSKMHYLLPERKMFPAPDVKHARLAWDMAKDSLDAGDISQDEFELVRNAQKNA